MDRPGPDSTVSARERPNVMGSSQGLFHAAARRHARGTPGGTPGHPSASANCGPRSGDESGSFGKRKFRDTHRRFGTPIRKFQDTHQGWSFRAPRVSELEFQETEIREDGNSGHPSTRNFARNFGTELRGRNFGTPIKSPELRDTHQLTQPTSRSSRCHRSNRPQARPPRQTRPDNFPTKNTAASTVASAKNRRSQSVGGR
jgi:hypothetical protein